MSISVKKRDGTKQPLDLDKFHKVAHFACEGITGVSVSDLELKTHIQFYNGIKTNEIQETLIKSAADLISEDAPNYQFVAGRLINYGLRKEVYGQYEPIHLWDHLEKCVSAGFYDNILGKEYYYTKDDVNDINKIIDHERDFFLSYAAMEQMRGKYLVKNRTNGKFYETPQMAYICIAMTLFAKYTEKRMQYIREFYDAISTFEISLPTPIMAGVRTPQRQFSSCVLIETDDSLDAINATSSAIVKYVSKKAGIGLGVGRIRAVGSTVRNGDVSHTGITPFIRLFESSVNSCSQGGVRKGSATAYFPIWHLEIEDLIVLKNNKGTFDNRVRQMDYCVQINQLFYERLIAGKNITLFSPHDVPDLYDAFFLGGDKFKNLYESYEKRSNIRKVSVPSISIFSNIIQERKETGRLYISNVDNMNDHGSFVKELAPIRMSNLCLEITLPTKPLKHIFDDEGRISLCTLAAINMGKIRTTKDFEKPCNILIRALNEILDFQEYPVIAAELATKEHRPLGVGVINLAYWMAKNDMTYTNPNLELVHEYMEAFSYYLIKASNDLAKEWGKQIGKPEDCLYSQGILPIDTYKRTVDELVAPNYKMDWDKLRADLKAHGIMNATLMAQMPSETSAQISNSTNGIEPPRSLVSIKQSKDGVLKQVVPGIQRLKNKYELLWDQKSPAGYLSICAVMQKFFDQAISVNTSYNPKFFPEEKIPTSVIMGDMMNFYRYGGKNLYYFNTNDGAGEIDVKAIDNSSEIDHTDESCDSCTI